MKPIKYAFTARAFYECLKLYGDKLFNLSNKLYVVEYTLINLPELKNATIQNNVITTENTNEVIAGIIYDHWFDIVSPPPFGCNEWKEELKILGNFQKTDPDNIIIVINNLQELSFLNRIYSDDELLTVSEVGAYLK